MPTFIPASIATPRVERLSKGERENGGGGALSGSHIHQLGAIVDKMQHQSSYPDFVNLDTQMIRNVDL